MYKSFASIRYVLIAFSLICLNFNSCKKFVEVDPPIDRTTGASVFSSESSAIAALTGIYTRLASGDAFASFATGYSSFSILAGLSSDEITLYGGMPTSSNYYAYYANSLYASAPSNAPGTESWPRLYSIIYTCNSAIEGLADADLVREKVKNQLMGEALFMRAFCYFYLANLYGNVPLIVSTDFKANASIGSSTQVELNSRIISDLSAAKLLLSRDFIDASLLQITSERVRPTY